MGWITWNETLETGHREMDASHQQLVSLVNKLARAMMNPVGTTTQQRLLDELFGEVKAHFAREERLMTKYGYPNAEQHCFEHAMLIKRARAYEYRQRLDAMAERTVSTLYFLEQWLTHHIESLDKELADFLKARMTAGNGDRS